jgi:hypothetical protein
MTTATKPSSLRKSGRTSGRTSRQVRIDPQGLRKRIYTPVPDENAWQTESEKREAIRSSADKEQRQSSVRPDIKELNIKWKIAYEPKQVDAEGNKMWRLFENNKKTLLLTTAGLTGLAAILSRKLRKGGANKKTRKKRR